MTKEKKIGEFVICNPEKLHRVIHGSQMKNGRLEGGLGEDASEAAILAEYDKLGGLIRTLEGNKVEMGSFYDFKLRKPRATPLVKVLEEKESSLNIRTSEAGDAEDEKPKRKGRKAKEVKEVEESEDEII